jgi:glycosyltransferase involved in cell wall biosynthesis
MVKDNKLPEGDLRRILFVINTAEYGGAEKHLIELVSSFRGSRVKPSILCPGPDFYSEPLNQGRNFQINVRCKMQPTSFWGWFQDFRDLKPDVVVFVYGWLWSFRWYATLAAWLAGARNCFSIQQLFEPAVEANKQGRPIRNALRKLLGGHTPNLMAVRISARWCKTTICVSNAVRESLVKNYKFPARRTVTIYNGVRTSEFVPSEPNRVAVRAKLGLSSEEFVLVCAARLSKIKGIEILISAMAKVVREGTLCKCIIVGDGPLREELSIQAQALDLRAHVFFEGFQEDVRPYLQAANAFVLTSHREGLPLSIVEAMACGLPCVVTNVGGNAEAVTHKVNGLVVSPGSVDEVADAISYLATHPTERALMSRKARDRACAAFDMDDRMAEIRRVILS